MKSSFVVLLVLSLTAVASAEEDNCSEKRSSWTSAVDEMSGLVRDSRRLQVECLFKGSRDKKLRQLADRMISLVDTVEKQVGAKLGKCQKNQVQSDQLMLAIARNTGEELGATVAACSKKAATIIKSKKSDKKKQAELEKLIQEYLKLN